MRGTRNTKEKKKLIATNPKLYGMVRIQSTVESIGLRRSGASSSMVGKKGTSHITHHTQAYSLVFRE